MKKIYINLLFCLLLIKTSVGQPAGLRGMYINNFDNIIGNSIEEDSLLHYAQDSLYNYMALYDLHTLNLNNSGTADMLASFIKRARENFGIQYVGAVCESYSGFQNRIAPYNDNRSDDNERFNVFNLEFEFWTTSSVNSGGYYCTQYLQQANCSCDTSGGFKFFIEQMHKIDSLAAVQQVISETYLGWFNQGQASQIAMNVDRVLLHAYRTSQSSLFSYSKTRLQYLASNNTTVDVAPIFSSEPAFMGSWLDNHAQIEAYNQYKDDYDNDNSSWKQYINVLGYTWFDWGYMPKPAPGSGGSFSPTITPSGPTTFCSGSSVTLSATSGNSYHWSTGATARNITVSSGGSYTCDVTLNGNTQTTPASIVTVKNLPSATITQSNAYNNLVPLTAYATAGSGTISTYQWRLNNNSINGSTQSTYNAPISGDYTVEVTNSYGCSTISNQLSLTIQASGISDPEISGENGNEILSLFPNPADQQIQLRFQSEVNGICEITLSDINSRIIRSEKITMNTGENNYKLNTSQIESGIYLISFNSERKVYTQKLIVKH